MVLSHDGNYIYILIASDDKLLANEAEREKHHMQLDIAMTDLLSFEPCDDELRPLFLVRIRNPTVVEYKSKLLRFYSEIIDQNENTFEKNLYKGVTMNSTDAAKEELWNSYALFLEKLYNYLCSIEFKELTVKQKKYVFLKYLKRAI